MYTSALDCVRNGICNTALPYAVPYRGVGKNYAEYARLTSLL
jgi:hypothetical protein